MLQPLTIYKSSAGSGKTYTLVQEYLKIVLLEPYLYKKVLAITFTNKATEEMKNRIIDALSVLAYETESTLPAKYWSLYNHLKEHLQEQEQTREISIKHQAQKVLTNILSDYSNFSVSTIESFFQRIIKAFSRELSLPMGYEIEMERNYVLDQITRASLLEVGENESLTKLIQRYVSQDMEEGKGWKVERKIKTLGEKIFSEKFQELSLFGKNSPEQQVDAVLEVVKELWKIRKQYEQRVLSIREKTLELLHTYQLSPQDFKYKNTSVVASLVKQPDFQKPDKLAPGKRMLTAVDEPESLYAKNSPRLADIEGLISGGLHDLIRERIQLHHDQYEGYLSAAEVLKHLYKFGVLSSLQEKLKVYREENRMLMISDTNLLLRSITGEEGTQVSANTPFIYEKVGTRYQHYLIDEFQDTSDMQWANLFPLLAESLATGNKSLLVGDVKQAIYRWRNGNMKLLMEDVAHQLQTTMGQSPASKQLNNNWRTRQEVVDFNNTFFVLAKQLLANALEENDFNILIETAYEEVVQKAQKVSSEEARGYVQYTPVTVEKGEDWKAHALQVCLDTILALEKEGYQKKDITLLVRRNHEGLLLAQFLQAHNISVYSAESLMIQSNSTVRFLLACLQFLNEPETDLFKAELSYYHDLTHEKEPDFSNIKQSKGEVQEVLLKHAVQLNEKTVYGALMLLCELFEIPLRSAYVLGILEEAWGFVHQQEGSIAGFLNWWENRKSSARIAASAHEEAVQIMTIHKAKGLEFPVVVLPFAEWPMGPNKLDILWIQYLDKAPFDQLNFFPVSAIQRLENTYFKRMYQEEIIQSYMDNLNLLYVAFTRPKDRLYLIAPTAKSSGRPNSVSALLQLIIPNPDLDMLEETGKWTYGEKVAPRQEKSDTPLAFLPLHTHKPFQWEKSAKIKYQTNTYLSTDIRTSRSKISEGELYHEALSYVKTQEDIPDAVERMRLSGKVAPEYLENFEKVLRSICARPEVQSWYEVGWTVKNEADLIDGIGNLLRPDRVMIQGDKAVVIDYKSGKHHARYFKQLESYKMAIQAMGYVQVEAFLYYILSGDLISLDQQG
ncbi:MAG: UvrD-helicase domain-containing protein [Bacteroidota bacterium]